MNKSLYLIRHGKALHNELFEKIGSQAFRIPEGVDPPLIKEGIEQSIAKKITADIKSSKIKVQVKINGNELRIDGKKKDDLQTVIQMIKDAKLGIPVQFVNYRD